MAEKDTSFIQNSYQTPNAYCDQLRPAFQTLLKRLQEPRRFIQVIAGPRQTGNTTITRQVAEAVSFPVHFATADEPALRDRNWLIQQWETARFNVTEGKKGKSALLVLDEAQKIANWSETVKRLWDEDSAAGLL